MNIAKKILLDCKIHKYTFLYQDNYIVVNMEQQIHNDKIFMEYLQRIRNQPMNQLHEYHHFLFHVDGYFQKEYVPRNYYIDIDIGQSDFAAAQKHGLQQLTSELLPPISEVYLPSENTKTVLKITIDRTIHSLQDLLDIIEDFPLVPDAEYNIDLKALHNIHVELQEINNMIGLKTFKNNLLDQLLYFIQRLHINREHDFKHMVIYGPPGSGKTQAAKLIGSMYAKLGILKNGIFRKVTRNDLVAGFLGQTAIKTNKVIQECLGGCLFIDEVYSLGCGGNSGEGEGGDSFSKECIDTLCEALSNYKEELMVIVAGYEEDVKESFFKMNSGLPSRFIWRFTVEEYSAKELMEIFLQKVEQNDWVFSDIAELPIWFENHREKFAYYGRDMEMLFTYTKVAHGRRIYGKLPELRKKITIADLKIGCEYFLKHSDHSSIQKKGLPDSCFGLYL